MNVKRLSANSRRPEEMAKFKQLMKTLIWAKGMTGRPSAEIIHAVLRSGKIGTYDALFL